MALSNKCGEKQSKGGYSNLTLLYFQVKIKSKNKELNQVA